MERPTSIVQFGTSRFLQAHADLFIHEGDPELGISVVQSSGDAARARRLGAMADPAGYPVRIRGRKDGRIVDEETRVKSVRRTLSTADDWARIQAIVTDEARLILSNTGDAGFDARPADALPHPDQGQSYPAKLFHLLAGRHAAGRAPLTLCPMELVPDNGSVLRACVMGVAEAQAAPADLVAWLDRCIWVNSLVDRIVSEPIEPVGAVAEPYALWAIEAQPGLELPIAHPAVRIVPSLERIERLKLHILNLGHTAMAAFWRRDGGDPDAIVRDLMEGPVGRALMDLMLTEVLPGFARRDMEPDARSYLDETVERFANPFLDHRIADIAQNHPQKVERRIGAFLDWVREADPAFAAPVLDKLRAQA
ncbi:mannitol dehydrogenase family protein [Paracoccus sp. PARArs4]|uniref:mannitol dehydrogenase family protein n=1 Tax=Paracoccus sp. PARArs4 TaxID=2853442 RepID=UPI0024A7588E|nr:mannitol dehydrogenase family protein [Paracoccus sp. PARArs4]